MDFIDKLTDDLQNAFTKNELIRLIYHLTYEEIKQLYIGESYKLRDLDVYLGVNTITRNDLLDIYKAVFEEVKFSKSRDTTINRIWEEKNNLSKYKTINWKDRYEEYMKRNGLWNIRSLDSSNYQDTYKLASIVEWDKIFMKGQLEDVDKITSLSLVNKGIRNIPVEIFNLHNLESLNLKTNKIINIPTEISKLQKLKILDLSGNDIEVIPNTLYLLQGLECLDLKNNKISDISEMIGNLHNLNYLDISGNDIKRIPKNIIDMKINKFYYYNNNDNKGKINNNIVLNTHVSNTSTPKTSVSNEINKNSSEDKISDLDKLNSYELDNEIDRLENEIKNANDNDKNNIIEEDSYNDIIEDKNNIIEEDEDKDKRYYQKKYGNTLKFAN